VSQPSPPEALPTLADVRVAAERLAGVARRTPVLTDPRLDARAGGRLFAKAEHHQPMGAFKLRGAYNAIAALPEEVRAGGVFTFSSGNHAQAVAMAAGLLGTTATILMPHDAPAVKRDATLALGASRSSV
jgi:threonine dehydratase